MHFKHVFLNLTAVVFVRCRPTSHKSKQLLQISSALISARKEPSDQGRPHTFKGPAAVANISTGIKNALVKRLFILNWASKHEGL
jgi:hypothetical protein